MKFSTLFKVLSACLILVSTQLLTPLSDATSPAPADTDLGVCAAPQSLPVARTQARQLVSQIRADLAAVAEQIRNVPFLAEVAAGPASGRAVAPQAPQPAHTLRHDRGTTSLS